MDIEQLVVGQLQTNCYLVFDENKKTVIIDPGDDGDFIIRKIFDLNLKPQLIIATHGHFDHVLAVTEIKLAFNIPFLMNKDDLFLLKNSVNSAEFFAKISQEQILKPDKFLKEKEVIKFGKEKLKVIKTPGHTPGSICLYSSGFLFSGDTIFAKGFGRTDFSYGNNKKLKNSLGNLFKLPGKTKVFPGHEETTILKKVRNLQYSYLTTSGKIL